MASYEDENGNYTYFTYDNLGREVNETDPADSDGNSPQTNFVYDPMGNVTSESVLQAVSNTDQLWRNTTYTYNSLEQLSTVSAPGPDGSMTPAVTTYTYTPTGNVYQITDADNGVETFAYNAIGEQTGDSLPDPASGLPGGPTKSTAYDPLGRMKSVISPPIGVNGVDGTSTTGYGYTFGTSSSPGMTVTTTLPNASDGSGSGGPQTIDVYDQNRNLVNETSPSPVDGSGTPTTYQYDPLGRPAQAVSPKNKALLGPTYDADGNVISDTDLENGAVTSYTYNARNELVQTTGPYPDPQHPISPTSSSESGTWLDDTITVTVPHVTEYATPVTPDGTGGGVGYRITYTTYTEDTATHYASGTGSSHAWSFSGLTEGQQYEFQVSLPDAGSGDITTNASFSYINGSDSSASIGTYDEALAARADYTTHDGTTATTWQGMVVFTAAGENASFELDSGDGHTLIPDVQLQKARPVTTYAYNLDGTLASETDPLGNTTAWTYDADGNEASMTLPDPATGENTSEVHGAVTDYAYDLVGNLTSTTYPSPTGVEDSYVTTTSTYDQANNLESTTDANGNVTTFAHNAVGDTLSLTDSDGNTTSWTYDRDGQQTSQSELVALGYYPDGTVQTAVATSYDFYDPAGNLTTTVDSDSRSITYTFDHLSEEKSEAWTDAAGGAAGGVAYSYDAAGYMTSASNGTGSSTTNVADYSYGYTTTGNVQTENINLAGLGTTAVTLAADYDYNNNRTTLAANIGGSEAPTFNSDGTFAHFNDGTNDFINTYQYNSLGEMKNEVQTSQTSGTYNVVAPKTVTFAYDSAERLTNVNRYATDDLGSLGSSTLVAGATYSYNRASELTGLTYVNGATSTLAAYHWDYNAASVVTDFYSRNDASSSPDSSYEPGTSNWGHADYAYDPTAQLTSTTYTDFANPPTDDTSLAYDPNGNRTANTLGSTTSATNRVLFDGTYFYQYDAAGNRIAQYQNSVTNQLDSDATDVTLYAWNNRNELVGIKHYADYSGTPVADWEITYGVDAFGRTVSRSPTGLSGETDENYVFDGANLALVLNDAGQVTERELYAPAVDAIMASEVVSPTSEGDGGGQAAGTTNWMLGDNNGTIRDVVQAGSVVEGAMTAELMDHVIYSAYGVPSQGADFTSDALPRFGFNGMRRDAATGLFFAQYRPYDPRTRRLDAA